MESPVKPLRDLPPPLRKGDLVEPIYQFKVTVPLLADSDDAKQKLAKQAYDLALLSQGMLEGKDLTDFVNRSVELSLA